MRTRRLTTIEKLRLAIDCLPRHTRVAMLEAIKTTPIIVGAYGYVAALTLVKCSLATGTGGASSIRASGLAYDGGRLFAVGDNGVLSAVDPATLNVIWS